MKPPDAHVRRADAKHVDRDFAKKLRDVNTLLDRKLSLPDFKRVGSSITLHSSSIKPACGCSENKVCDDVVIREVSTRVCENAKQKILSSKIELIDCSEGCKS